MEPDTSVGACLNPSANSHKAGEFPDHCDNCWSWGSAKAASPQADGAVEAVKCGGCKRGCSSCGFTHAEPIVVEDFKGTIDGKGSKVALDGSKLRVELVPPQVIEGIAAVLSYGAKKYAANNWMRGISYMGIIAGVLRHLYRFIRGQEYDIDTGLPELYHAMCGLTFLAYYTQGPNAEQYRAFDDRPFKGGK